MVNGPDDDVEREEARKHAMPHKGHAPRRVSVGETCLALQRGPPVRRDTAGPFHL